MPMYTQRCEPCDMQKVIQSKIAERDNQYCPNCNTKMKRLMDVPGMVWAPTASNGGTHK